jgi:hypothetical protein
MARLLALLLLMPLAASAADDPRISFLEQEVRNLQRQVQALSRQLDDLRTRPDRVGAPSSVASGASPSGSELENSLPRWVDAALWKRLRTGTSELEVLSALGRPNSMREESGAQVLLYAMEIGSSGFLGGSVKLRDHAVVEVHPPVLQ